eukprot:1152118-Pelagomonas_calceolata.AAC.2
MGVCVWRPAAHCPPGTAVSQVVASRCAGREPETKAMQCMRQSARRAAASTLNGGRVDLVPGRDSPICQTVQGPWQAAGLVEFARRGLTVPVGKPRRLAPTSVSTRARTCLCVCCVCVLATVKLSTCDACAFKPCTLHLCFAVPQGRGASILKRKPACLKRGRGDLRQFICVKVNEEGSHHACAICINSDTKPSCVDFISNPALSLAFTPKGSENLHFHDCKRAKRRAVPACPSGRQIACARHIKNWQCI